MVKDILIVSLLLTLKDEKMIKNIVIVLLFVLTAHADIMSFYKNAIKTVQYNKSYALYEESSKISQKALTATKFANFSANIAYSKTYASGDFATTDFSLQDSMDIFGKNDYKMHTIGLDRKSKKAELNLKKEQLFISLVTMITMYNKTVAQISLYKTVFKEQKSIYEKLEKLQQQGAITNIDLLRFKNQLTSLKITIMHQENEIIKMKKELHLYAPNQKIPRLKSTKLLYSEKAFLNKNPQIKRGNVDAQKLLVQAEGLHHSYLPEVTVGATYQQNDDPTSYGNNYSFTIGLNIPLNAGNLKEAQALKVKALRLKSKNRAYEMQRKNEYIRRYQEYINASQELKILNENLDDYKESDKTIKTAYLRQYIDFNTYMQVIMQTLHIKEQMLGMQSKKELESTLLNSIASGAIYE